MLSAEIKEIVKLTKRKNVVTLSGIYGSSISFLIKDFLEEISPIIYIVDREDRYKREAELKFLEITTLNLNNSPYPVNLNKVKRNVIITTEEELLRTRVIDKEKQIELEIRDKPGLNQVEEKIFQYGYHREYNVSESLEFAKRGGIIDFYPPDRDLPVRIEFEDDCIVSLREFDPLTQRSIRSLNHITIYDSRPDTDLKKLLEVLPENCLFLTKNPIANEYKTVVYKEGGTADMELPISPPRLYLGKIDDLQKDVKKGKYLYTIFLPSATQIERLMNRIGNRDVLAKLSFVKGDIKNGFIDNKNQHAYLTESEIFGNITIPRPKPKFKGLFIDDLLGMKVGEYIVHRDYGIGKYLGLTKLAFDGMKQECLLIEYAGGDRLYLSVEHINLIERYIGSKTAPQLSKLGSNWFKIRKKARARTEKYVVELLNLYAKRSIEEGISFEPDYYLEAELENSFPYELTDDQRASIDDVLNDMAKNKPMDRLVCGDVGYGKTEVAIQAAVRAVINGYQVAVLCPTTILALQHYQTFKKRLAKFPFMVDMLSRLVKNDEIEAVLSRIGECKADIIVGTHRLLKPDVRFGKLGLLIIDDEHRFGVKQKENIKKYRTKIDVLTLTATPLPRTLYMSLTGIRDVSLINTPPVGRQDIHTEVLEWENDWVRKAIWFEVDRGGQVFFIHNRIKTIGEIKDRLIGLLPGIKIAVVHGRLSEREISRRIFGFTEREYDVLLSTSIIEAGIDMPGVNTIIVDQAHLFGLADLHQLRGRVGRSHIKGYAYFIIPEETNLSIESKKRLSALTVYCSLGSGFRLAIRDMEIRGVGNILGSKQHGVINRIGYGLYMRLLRQAIAELKGKRIYPEPKLDLKMDAYIPDQYIGNQYERVAIYKRLFSIEERNELEKIKDELVDRFGKYHQAVGNLFDISLVRLRAQQKGVESIYSKDNNYIITYRKSLYRVPKNITKLISFLEKDISRSITGRKIC